jgi:hypothetical protein
VRDPRHSLAATGRPSQPVERPASVVRLTPGEVFEVRLDRGLVEETTGDRVGVRREVERRVNLALGVEVERDPIPVEQLSESAVQTSMCD